TKDLQFIGSVGTGFDQKAQKDLLARLEKLRIARSPLRNPPKLREHVEWVRPAIVARVKFANWTEDNHLRAPVFLSIRKDRTPEECTFAAARGSETTSEPSVPPPPPKPQASASTDSGLAELSNGKSENLRLLLDSKTLALTHLNKIYF